MARHAQAAAEVMHVRSILLTGASGFVGRFLLGGLLDEGHVVSTAGRAVGRLDPRSPHHVLDSADDGAILPSLFEGVDTVIHCAGITESRNAGQPYEESAERRVNARGTQRLAEHAREAGVRRFIHFSTVKVVGESTTGRTPFRESDPPEPQDFYGRSKAEAEELLRATASDSGMSVTIIRLPAVLGRDMKGNAARLRSLVRKGLPIPFGAVRNRRSVISLANILAFTNLILQQSVPPDRTYFIQDPEPLSTPDLVRIIAHVEGRAARLIPVPLWLLRLAGALLLRSADADRLLGDLVVDDSAARLELDWAPPLSTRDALFTNSMPV